MTRNNKIEHVKQNLQRETTISNKSIKKAKQQNVIRETLIVLCVESNINEIKDAGSNP